MSVTFDMDVSSFDKSSCVVEQMNSQRLRLYEQDLHEIITDKNLSISVGGVEKCPPHTPI